MEYYPVWISKRQITKARTEFEWVKRENPHAEIITQSVEDILHLLEISLPVGIRGNSSHENVLYYRTLESSLYTIVRERGDYVMRLLDLLPATVPIRFGGTIFEIWGAGHEVILDPGDEDVAKAFGTRHIPFGSIPKSAGNVNFHDGNSPNLMEITISLGYIVEVAYVPESLDKEERGELQKFLETYQQDVRSLTNFGSNRALKQAYPDCTLRRQELYRELADLGWRLQNSVTQVDDLRFREWDHEQNKWNINRVVATFQR